MAETTAYVLGASLEARREIVSTVADIYRARSAIVLGGNFTTDDDLSRRAVDLVSSLIAKLLTDPNLAPLTSAQALGEWIQERKYL